MKTLYLIRHAKASWDNPEQQDFDRPLTSQGEQDAKAMAEELVKYKDKIDYIISSNAVRAISTAEIMAEELKFPLKKIMTNERIYNGGVEELVQIIKGFSANVNTALFFGHNPSLTWIAHYLCEAAKMNIATCGVLGIQFDVKNWDDIASVEGKMRGYFHPHHEHSDHN